MAILEPRAAYSLLSATNSAGGTAIDCRATRGLYAFLFSTGNSAILTVQASHSTGADAAWLPVATVTGLNNTGQSAVSLNYYPYLRGHVSGYAGTTASVYIAPGVQ